MYHRQARKNIQRLKTWKQPEMKYPSEILLVLWLKKDNRYASNAIIKHAIKTKLRVYFSRMLSSLRIKSIIDLIYPLKQKNFDEDLYQTSSSCQRKVQPQFHHTKIKRQNLLIHMSRKVLHINIILMFSIGKMFPSHKIWFQDVTQANIQRQDLQRYIYVKPAN